MPRADAFKGATNPKVTQENIKRTICRSGWTSTIRPTVSYTNALKKTEVQSTLLYTKANKLPRVKTASGKSTRWDIRKCVARSSNLACYEEDHLISLELGGHPTNPENLWPEPWFGNWNAHVKDHLENVLNDMVCNGQITLREAQRAIATDWVAAYKKFVGES